MLLIFLTDDINFPPVSTASPEGIVAIGGNLLPSTLLKAYRHGIFPWFNEDEPITWWSPDPRCVLFPEEVCISKSMQSLLRKDLLRFSVNEAFDEVIANCRMVNTQKHGGSWITDDMTAAYTALHQQGFACSAEAWLANELVGGLYGVRIGKVFFGESMFSKASNASKFAFIKMVQHLQQDGIVLIDCQQHTPHLESLGATVIKRELFIKLLNAYCGEKL